MDFLALVREKMQARRDGRDVPEPRGQRGLLGRREEAQRDPPDGGARAAARDPRRDRLRPRHRRAARSSPTASTRCAAPERAIARDHPLPAPARLHRARLRPRARGRPHRQVGRQGARARARARGLRLARARARGRARVGPRSPRSRSAPDARRPRGVLRGRHAPRLRCARLRERGARALRRRSASRPRATRTGGTRTSRRSRASASRCAGRDGAARRHARSPPVASLAGRRRARVRGRPLRARRCPRRRALPAGVAVESLARRSRARAGAGRAAPRHAWPRSTTTAVRGAQHRASSQDGAFVHAAATACALRDADPRAVRLDAPARRPIASRIRASWSSPAPAAAATRRRELRRARRRRAYFTNAVTEIVARRGRVARPRASCSARTRGAFHVARLAAAAGRATAAHARTPSRSAAALVAQRPRRRARRRGRRVRARRALPRRRRAARRPPHRRSTTRAARHEPRALQGHPRRARRTRRLQRQGDRAPGRAEDRRAADRTSNLLLGDGAEIDTKPQLEIFADDVKCSHGATVGQLDEDALFYLRSRGIDEADAREPADLRASPPR